MYLALTANGEFWDKDDEILFLGEWCKLYSEQIKWKKLKYHTFPFVWDNRTDFEKAYAYCNSVFELFLKDLSSELNEIHNMHFSKQYYRIVLGNWLQHYIYQMYDRYITIKSVFKQYPDLSTILLDVSDNIVPVDYQNFMRLISAEDDYNLQTYSAIIRFLGYKFPEKKLINRNKQQRCKFKPDIMESTFNKLSFIAEMLTSLLYNDSQTATIVNPYFLYGKIYKLMLVWWKSRGRFVFNRFQYNYDFQYTLDFEKRGKLFQRKTLSGDEFYNLLKNNIVHDIPVLFLELFSDFNSFVADLPVKRTKVFFSTTSFYSNNTFKFFVAQNYKSITSIEAQHGGGNGTHLMTMDELDQKVSDYFFTFGWKEKYNQVPFIHANASTLKRKPAGKQVLYVRTGQPRYINRFHSSYSGTEFKDYIESGIIFLKHVDRDMDLMIRLYPNEEYKWFVKERMLDSGIRFQFDDFSKRFDYMLQHAYIYVSDHVMSTFLEAMAANIPTIVFCDPEITKYRKSAAPIMDNLKAVKILHDSPLSAADHLNAVYDNVDKWWNDPEVKKSRKLFCSRYARTAKNWSSVYVKTILDFTDDNAHDK